MADKKDKEYNLPDNIFNPIRIKPPEGQMMAVMKGTKNGPLDQIVASVTGWHFASQESGFISTNEWDGWELRPDVNSSGARAYTPKPSMPEAEFGIIVVGLGRALHIPHLRYTKWELPPGKTEPGLVVKDRTDSPFFFFQYTMAIPVLEVESRGNFKTTIKINVVIRLTNPYKAQFLAGGWESLLDAAVHAAVRDHISDLTVADIRAIQESGGLSTEIKNLNNDPNDGFKAKFGVEIIDVRFVGFEIVGSSRVQDALEANEVNRLLAEAATNKAQEITTISTAEGAAAARVVAGYGGNPLAAAGVQVAKIIAEALKK